jgi:plasmid stabilization system protein ParE
VTRRATWTARARSDLARIDSYIGARNPAAAERVLERILAATERTAAHPRLGRIVPERGREDLRESIEGKYRVVYRIVGSGVEIITVFHGAREFPDDVK